jgi:hypothetical protein
MTPREIARWFAADTRGWPTAIVCCGLILFVVAVVFR